MKKKKCYTFLMPEPGGTETRPKTPPMTDALKARLRDFNRRHGQPDPFGSSAGEQGATDPAKQGGRKEPPSDPKKALEDKVLEAEKRAQEAEVRAQADKMALHEALGRAILAESSLRHVEAANVNVNRELGAARDDVRRLRGELEQARAQARTHAAGGMGRESASSTGAGDSKGYYRALGLDSHVFEGMTEEQIGRMVKAVYRVQAMIHHTDMPGAHDEQRIKDINNARDTFLNPIARGSYR